MKTAMKRGGLVLGQWFSAVDRILRGEATHPAALREQAIDLPLAGLTLVILGLAISYGACMGMYAGIRAENPSNLQWLATTLKVPALFFLTLAVTFPSLYVFNALVGSRLRFVTVLQLLVASLAVNLAVLASLGPIVAFFSLSTTSYSFMVLLNVAVMAVSGVLGMEFLQQTLHRLSVAPQTPDAIGPAAGEARPVDETSALDRLQGHVLGRHVKTVFACWTLIFAVVGGQMAWVLRPFFGRPNEAFQWFGPRDSNFFEGVWQTFRMLIS